MKITVNQILLIIVVTIVVNVVFHIVNEVDSAGIFSDFGWGWIAGILAGTLISGIMDAGGKNRGKESCRTE